MNRLTVSASLFAALVGIQGASGQALTRGPYLLTETPHSIVVRWRTNTASDSRVHYGASPSTLTQFTDVTSSVTEHIVQLSGLTPDTTYYYSVGSTTAVVAGGDANHFFKTGPATERPTHIWVLGDSGTADNNQSAVRDAYFKVNGSAYTDLILMLGDNAYNSGTDAEYQGAVFNMYPSILQQSVLWATLGNHDGLSANSLTQTGPFYNIFSSYPRNGEAGGLASGTAAYFSFEFGNIHFVNLDSFDENRLTGGPMMTWLQNDLAQNTKQWVIAFWHHPPYTKGSHDSDTESELMEMRQNALPILEAAGVDLVLSGHSHSYERSFLIDGHYGLSTSFTNSMKKNGGDGRPSGNGAYVKPSVGEAPHEGAVYAVAGSSGQTSGGPLNYPAMFISLNQLGSMVLDINGGRLDAIFLDSTGATRDSFTLLKGGPPPAPTGLTATAASANQINLSWKDNSNNETSFLVEQSPDGITFSPVASTPANTTTYSVTGLSAGVRYYFRVTAVSGASGNSQPSNVANAITGGSTTPTLSSVSPSSGAQGATVPVTLSGTNFAAGATVAVSGTGIAVSNVTVVNSTQITATFTVALNATPASYNVSVSATGGVSNTMPFTVTSSAPVVTSITPNSGTQGTAVNVTLTGSNFVSGATVGISGSGVTVSNVSVTSSTQITATFTVAASAAAGSYNASVTTTGGTSNTSPFIVNGASGTLTLTSISPSSGAPGTSVNVTLTGTNFTSASQVRLQGAGLTQTNIVVVSPTTITATYNISASTAPGAHNTWVVTGTTSSNMLTFTVNGTGSAPMLTSVTPNSGIQGTAVNVTLNGTNFISGATVAATGSGVTISNVAVASATQITAKLTIGAGVALGASNISVTTSAGTSGTVPFTVNAAVPTLTSVSPNSGGQGTAVNVTLNGTNFISGATVAATGSGVTVSNVAVASGTQITATLTIGAGATPGASNISVTTSGGTSNTVPFTVNAGGPTLTSVSPNSGGQGAAVNVTLTGTNFISGATVGISGSGITAGNVVVASSTQITATLTIAASATVGAYNVSVNTSGGTSNTATFTVSGAAGGAPTLSSVTPSSGARGTSVNVTLTGTNFAAGSQVRLVGAGLTQTNIVVVSPTQITATYNISSTVATGPHSTWVVTPGGSSNILTFTVN